MKRCWQDANQEDSDGEQDEDWSSTNSSLLSSPSFKNVPLQPPCPASGKSLPAPIDESDHSRTIIHVDLDCFYAQVEMIRNPELRTQPLGIQQKNIVVTCNYVAREFGVKKLMYLSDAKKKCPQLVLVSGEDLTHYREYSEKVTDLLQSEFSSLVEKLGFDENFVDVTSLVEKTVRASGQQSQLEVKGHTFSPDVEIACFCGCHKRMAVGSQIAAKMRERLREVLGITGCAGIAWNKLLAKLVGEQNKPNDQTTLLPGSEEKLMLSLGNARRIPGIGHSMNKKLEALGIITIADLQTASFSDLEKVFGLQAASTMRYSSFGIDKTPVSKAGPPKSMSDEDSFKSCTSLTDAKERMYGLLKSLLGRLEKDGRIPLTIRLTVRKYSSTQKWLRESRQGQIPNTITEKIAKGIFDLCDHLMEVLLVLFDKLVDVKKPFHLTLINICLANFQAKSTQSERLDRYFSRPKSSEDNAKSNSDLKATDNLSKTTNGCSSSLTRLNQNKNPKEESSKKKMKHSPLQMDHENIDDKTKKFSFFRSKSSDVIVTSQTFQNKREETTSKRPEGEGSKNVINTTDEHSEVTSPANSTAELKSLESDLSKDISLASATQTGGVASKGAHGVTAASEEASEEHMSSQVSWESSTIPGDVDMKVFRSLPEDIQKDLLRQWKAETTGNATQQTKNNSTHSRPAQPSTSHPRITDFFRKSSK